MQSPLNIKKIAIIGGGPGGLVTLNELLHTSSDGASTITSPHSANKYPSNPAFDEIVVFEQNECIGGVWNYSDRTDPKFPQYVDDYSKPNGLRPNLASEINDLNNCTEASPCKVPIDADVSSKLDHLWNKSGVYDHLFTNIPNHLMRFSTSFDEPVKLDHNSKAYQPFATHPNVINYLKNYAKKYDLEKYVRFNSSVEKVYKVNDKWHLTICKVNKSTNTLEYYTEKFDAVVVSVGRFNIPFYPFIIGQKEFNEKHPGVIEHSKSFRRTDDLIGKKVLIVGSSISAMDIAQYLIPVSDLHISSNTKGVPRACEPTENTQQKAEWTDKVFEDPSLNWTKHGRIAKFEADTVIFEDGSQESNFDAILYCTGYHLYFPFLDIPENEGKGYISVTSGYDGNPNYALTKVDNLYLYTFTINDPTLCHTGIAQNPLFFLTSEANAVAIAGCWSGNKKLPSLEVQRNFIKSRHEGKKRGFQSYDETQIREFIRLCYELAPSGRFDFVPYIREGDIMESKEVLHDLFFKFAKGEYNEFDPSLQFSDLC